MMRADAGEAGLGDTGMHTDLVVLLVHPHGVQRNAIKAQLQALPIVKAAGGRNTPHFVLDALSENALDVVMFDEACGWENILDTVREVRAHPAAEHCGFVVLSQRLGPEVTRRGSQVGILGYAAHPLDAERLEQALRDALGEVRGPARANLAAMRQVRFFQGFDDRELLRLMNICTVRQLEPGAYLFREGEPGERLYVTLEGHVEVRKHLEGEHRLLATLPPGTTLGEMAILDNDPRSADAVARDHVRLFEIDHATLNEDDSQLCLKLARQIAVELAGKLRQMNARK